jgi:hypothetical protein
MNFKLVYFQTGQVFLLMGVKRNSKDDQPNRSDDRSKNKPTKCEDSYMSFGFTNVFVENTRTASTCVCQ